MAISEDPRVIYTYCRVFGRGFNATCSVTAGILTPILTLAGQTLLLTAPPPRQYYYLKIHVIKKYQIYIEEIYKAYSPEPLGQFHLNLRITSLDEGDSTLHKKKKKNSIMFSYFD